MTHTVPIFHIDRFNVAKHTPVLFAALKASEVISIDLELSGLGKRPGISSKDLTKRYQGLFITTFCFRGFQSFLYLDRAKIRSATESALIKKLTRTTLVKL